MSVDPKIAGEELLRRAGEDIQKFFDEALASGFTVNECAAANLLANVMAEAVNRVLLGMPVSQVRAVAVSRLAAELYLLSARESERLLDVHGGGAAGVARAAIQRAESPEE
jgi:hypothetical protein